MISLTIGEWLSSNLFDCVSLILAAIGGFFALHQWKKSNIYKRGEIVEKLIKAVRDDEDIATIMDVVDWNDGIEYDGKFYISQTVERSDLNQLDDEELFKKVDKTLAHFSYICYLRSQRHESICLWDQEISGKSSYRRLFIFTLSLVYIYWRADVLYLSSRLLY